MSDLLRLRAVAQPAAQPRDRTSLIVIWQHGGASHLETYDPKPEAPQEFRGPFKAIDTKVPGLRLCELLPLHAAMADRFTIVRSLAHSGFDHQQGAQQLFTGHEVTVQKNKPDHPDCFAVVTRLRSSARRSVPVHVGVPPLPYSGAAYLGAACEPFEVHGDPNNPSFQVPNIGIDSAARMRLQRRLPLLDRFDQVRKDIDAAGNMEAIDTFQEQAWNILTGPSARRAFDLSREDPRVRDRYGRHRWGQSCLLARRLVEAGVDVVTTSFLGVENALNGSWDDHAVNCNCFDAMKQRAPYFDQAVTALIEDLAERGLTRRVMVIVTGEFGRTPRINAVNGVPGRDHWANACSMLFAGGGTSPGHAIGATDRRGELVIERKIAPRDILATIYGHLGIDTAGLQFRDFFGRPIPVLPDGTPIPELSGARA
ncbi:MAG TPA: DUF1501 domain-containing protein [Isosphaeraceae bacterium]|nr:DUF1501 domain-containing protein [Isosphaeraceae bacterium]